MDSQPDREKRVKMAPFQKGSIHPSIHLLRRHRNRHRRRRQTLISPTGNAVALPHSLRPFASQKLLLTNWSHGEESGRRKRYIFKGFVNQSHKLAILSVAAAAEAKKVIFNNFFALPTSWIEIDVSLSRGILWSDRGFVGDTLWVQLHMIGLGCRKTQCVFTDGKTDVKTHYLALWRAPLTRICKHS
jgi:hypothetical protein